MIGGQGAWRMADLMMDVPNGKDGGQTAIPPKNGGVGRIKGVFTTTLKGVVGFGHTKKRTAQSIHVYVEEMEDGRFSIQPLNDNFVPSGAIECVSREELLNSYVPEPALYTERVLPAMNALTATIARGERHFQKGETFSAEFEFKNALRVDEENIRATFGLGLTYLERGDSEKGALVFKRLAKLKNPFQQQHKHLFNDFGIQLRKNKLYVQALKHYARAYKLCKTDEHLLYNIARTLYEKGNLQACERFCQKALKLKKNFVEARDLLEIAKRRQYRERELRFDF